MIHEDRVEADSVGGSAWLRFGLQGDKGLFPAACPQKPISSAYSEPNFREPTSVVLAARHK